MDKSRGCLRTFKKGMIPLAHDEVKRDLHGGGYGAMNEPLYNIWIRLNVALLGRTGG